MGKIIGYKHGYRIIISDGFYEVINGRVVTHFGQCDKSATIQEIFNKTILKEKVNVVHRRKGFRKVIRKEVPRRNLSWGEDYERKNAIGM